MSISQQIAKTIQMLGMKVKYNNINTYGVWGEKIESYLDTGTGTQQVIEKSIIYIPLIKVAPIVGDTLIVNKIIYSVDSVQSYMQKGTSIGFKLEVTR